MKWGSVLLLICMFACSCISSAGCSKTQPPEALTPSPQNLTPTLSATPTDVIRVHTWVSDPTPERGEQVIAYGSLIKNGALLGGIMMQGAWVDKAHEPGRPNCFVLVTYGRGVCIIETGQFPAGRYVPVDIRFDYRNKSYTGSTGFTPR